MNGTRRMIGVVGTALALFAAGDAAALARGGVTRLPIEGAAEASAVAVDAGGAIVGAGAVIHGEVRWGRPIGDATMAPLVFGLSRTGRLRWSRELRSAHGRCRALTLAPAADAGGGWVLGGECVDGDGHAWLAWIDGDGRLKREQLLVPDAIQGRARVYGLAPRPGGGLWAVGQGTRVVGGVQGGAVWWVAPGGAARLIHHLGDTTSDEVMAVVARDDGAAVVGSWNDTPGGEAFLMDLAADGARRWLQAVAGREGKVAAALASYPGGGWVVGARVRPAGGSDTAMAVVRTDDAGAERWRRVLEPRRARVAALLVTGDGRIVAVGDALRRDPVTRASERDLVIATLTPQGDVLAVRHVGAPGPERLAEGAVVTGDAHVLVVGTVAPGDRTQAIVTARLPVDAGP